MMLGQFTLRPSLTGKASSRVEMKLLSTVGLMEFMKQNADSRHDDQGMMT